MMTPQTTLTKICPITALDSRTKSQMCTNDLVARNVVQSRELRLLRLVDFVFTIRTIAVSITSQR